MTSLLNLPTIVHRMKNQHTPGPWRIDTNGGNHLDQIVIVDADDYTVCGTVGHASVPRNMANARLIASAPELLAALDMARDVLSELKSDHASAWHDSEIEAVTLTIELTLAAIQKAEGTK